MTKLTHYFELKAIPQAEITQGSVIAHIFQALHIELVKLEGRVGLAFPAYGLSRSIGGIIRVFGEESDLKLLSLSLLKVSSLLDYAFSTEIKEIPESVKGYATFERVRKKGKSDLNRLKRRLKSQGKWSDGIEENALAHYDKPLNEPFITLKSHSTQQQFSLWIRRTYKIVETVGEFNSYGLSNQATVPIF